MALALAAAPAFAQAPTPPAPPPPVDYASAANWVCLPGRDDACSRPLPTADLEPNGYGPVTQSSPAADPPIDCFYVYPTVSRDPGLNSDLSPSEEPATAMVQFARFVDPVPDLCAALPLGDAERDPARHRAARI